MGGGESVKAVTIHKDTAATATIRRRTIKISMSKKNVKQPKTKVEAKAQPDSLQQLGSTRTLADCYLEHAARETTWMSQFGKECNYRSAADAEVRRGVWLMAALIAQERKA